MAGRAVFAPVADDARLTWSWAAPFVGLGFVALIQIPMVIVALVGAAAAGVAAQDPESLGTMFWPIVAAVLAGFAALIGLTMLWIRGFERRSLASAGWIGRVAALRYLRGVLAGVLLASLLLGASWAVAPEGFQVVREGAGALVASRAGVIVLGALAVMFVIQAGAEEFAFRGWMLSSLAARHGVAFAVILSSIAFGLAHIHYIFFAPVAGWLAIATVTFVGATFAVYAVREGGVIGAGAAHAAYNFTLVTVAIAEFARRSEADDLRAISVEAILESTQVLTLEPELIAATIASAAVFVLFTIAAVRRPRAER